MVIGRRFEIYFEIGMYINCELSRRYCYRRVANEKNFVCSSECFVMMIMTDRHVDSDSDNEIF